MTTDVHRLLDLGLAAVTEDVETFRAAARADVGLGPPVAPFEVDSALQRLGQASDAIHRLGTLLRRRTVLAERWSRALTVDIDRALERVRRRGALRHAVELAAVDSIDAEGELRRVEARLAFGPPSGTSRLAPVRRALLIRMARMDAAADQLLAELLDPR